MAIVLIDSYSESNYNNDNYIYGAGTFAEGESFTNADTDKILDSCQFDLAKQGSPTGNCYAKIYAHTGTYGGGGYPTGDVLAVSDAVDVSTTITGFNELIPFTFSGANRIILSADTYYCVVFEYMGGDVSNRIWIARDASSPTHSGNHVWNESDTWQGGSSIDTIFYVYGEEIINNTGNFFLFF